MYIGSSILEALCNFNSLYTLYEFTTETWSRVFDATWQWCMSARSPCISTLQISLVIRSWYCQYLRLISSTVGVMPATSWLCRYVGVRTLFVVNQETLDIKTEFILTVAVSWWLWHCRNSWFYLSVLLHSQKPCDMELKFITTWRFAFNTRTPTLFSVDT